MRRLATRIAMAAFALSCAGVGTGSLPAAATTRAAATDAGAKVGVRSAPAVSRKSARAELTFRLQHDWSPEPLATDRLLSLDPAVPNPHRQRWALGRELALTQIDPVQRHDGTYGVAAAVLDSKARVLLRPRGPWYRPIYEYPCAAPAKKGAHGHPAEADASSGPGTFATEAGVRAGAEAAAQLWDEILDARKTRLELLLGQVSAPASDALTRRARFIFDEWRRESELEWRRQAYELALRAGRKADAQAAHAAGVCENKGAAMGEGSPSWSAIMEAPPPENRARILVRAPARRWNGLFTVRLDVVIGARRLNGQFLIDSSARHSLVSPAWLEGQGMPAEMIERSDRPLQRMVWSRGASGLLRTVVVDRVDMSGYSLDLHEFLISETSELFTPPEFQASCCDGVLGSDFLARHVVEFLPGVPPAVRLWSREGFRFPESGAWIEASTSVEGDPESLGCSIVADKPRARGESATIPGVRWDTGDEVFLDVHRPWQQLGRTNGRLWSVRCDAQDVAEHVPVTLPQVSGSLGSNFFASVKPGATAGMSLLDRGPVAFDLPHGRLWFSAEALKARFRADRSGLDVEFVEDKAGERRLRVASIKPGTPAESLLKAGLKPGQLLEQINSKPAEDMDLWEVRRHLAGDYGTSLTIQWRAPGGERKSAPIHLAP